MAEEFNPKINFDANVGLTSFEYATWKPNFKPLEHQVGYMQRLVHNDNRKHKMNENFEEEKNDIDTYLTYDLDFLLDKFFNGLDTTSEIEQTCSNYEPSEKSDSTDSDVMSFWESLPISDIDIERSSKRIINMKEIFCSKSDDLESSISPSISNDITDSDEDDGIDWSHLFKYDMQFAKLKYEIMQM